MAHSVSVANVNRNDDDRHWNANVNELANSNRWNADNRLMVWKQALLSPASGGSFLLQIRTPPDKHFACIYQ